MVNESTSGNATVDAMVRYQIKGNVTPVEWFRTIVRKNGKPHLLAITILSDLVYWYRPTEIRDERSGTLIGWKKRFKADLLQKDYNTYVEMLGESKNSIKAAFDVLEELGVITRILRNVVVVGHDYEEYNPQNSEHENRRVIPNVMYVDLHFKKLDELTYPEKYQKVANDDIVETPESTDFMGSSECFADIPKNNAPYGQKEMGISPKIFGDMGENFQGYGQKEMGFIPESFSGYGQKFLGTNTKNTTESNYTESTSSSPFLSGEVPNSISMTRRDKNCTEELEPAIILDRTMLIDEIEVDNMLGLLEEKNGIPYQWNRNPEIMTTAIQILASWNLIIQHGNHNRKDSEWEVIYVCMVKNFIEMCVARDTFRAGGNRRISYAKVIDAVNSSYHSAFVKDGMLETYFAICVDRYIAASTKSKIQKVDEYCKTILWNTLSTFEADWQGYFNRHHYGNCTD